MDSCKRDWAMMEYWESLNPFLKGERVESALRLTPIQALSPRNIKFILIAL